jgi:acylphosphatase
LEFEVFGEENKIKKFIEECHKGPIFSKVLKIDISMVSYTEHKNFEIKV